MVQAILILIFILKAQGLVDDLNLYLWIFIVQAFNLLKVVLAATSAISMIQIQRISSILLQIINFILIITIFTNGMPK